MHSYSIGLAASHAEAAANHQHGVANSAVQTPEVVTLRQSMTDRIDHHRQEAKRIEAALALLPDEILSMSAPDAYRAMGW